MHKSKAARRIEMLAVARLAAEGRKPVAIASILGITTVDVSRHLKDARGSCLRTLITFVDDSVSAEEMEKVNARLTRQYLEDQVNQFAQRYRHNRKLSLRVFHCGSEGSEFQRMQRLAAAAAPTIKSLLLRSKSCGLTWGGMLESVVAALQSQRMPAPWGEERIEFIPLSGEPLGREGSKGSSSSLARDLSVLVNGDKLTGSNLNSHSSEVLSLAMVPAFIPDAFAKPQQVGVRRLINLVRAYEDIFGRHQTGRPTRLRAPRANPKAMNMDMVLTSVASMARPLGFGQGMLFDNMSVSYHTFKGLLAAEVGGVCIGRDNLTRAEKAELKKVQDGWTGLRQEHLQHCAERGQSSLHGPPGVVVVSCGSDRAGAVSELIKRGLVNNLIIDEVLARELEAVTGKA
jgi:DNA-binding transcriptional regulator LsrR (DeoR family)